MAEKAPQLKRELGLRDLTLFAITCIVGTRWIPAAAHAGPGSVTLWLLAAVLFMVPLAIRGGRALREISRSRRPLSLDAQRFRPLARLPRFLDLLDGHRVLVSQRRHVLHERRASRARPRYAHLAENRVFLLAVSLLAIWVALGTNLVGMKIGKWTENIGARRHLDARRAAGHRRRVVWSGAAARPRPSTSLPIWNWDTVSFWATIAYAMCGLEMAGLMGGEIRDPAAHPAARRLDRLRLHHRVLRRRHHRAAGHPAARKNQRDERPRRGRRRAPRRRSGSPG